MINFTIDELTHCLKNTITGEIVETEVIQIKRKSFLSKYNRNTGWIVDWDKFLDENEVYALVIKGTVDIQGLIAIRNDKSSKAVYIQWAVTSPNNNKWDFDNQEYLGVGGHLFAIAVAKSKEFGYEGTLYADASTKEILDYYVDNFDALHIPTRAFPHRFIIDEVSANKISEVYDFDWKNFTM